MSTAIIQEHTDFMYTLTRQDTENKQLTEITFIKTWGGRRKSVCAFTEQGIAMLSSVLKSKRAVQVNIQIMRTFTRLRELLASNELLIGNFKCHSERSEESKNEILRFAQDDIFNAIKKLIEPDPPKPKRQIGFLSRKISDFTKEESL